MEVKFFSLACRTEVLVQSERGLCLTEGKWGGGVYNSIGSFKIIFRYLASSLFSILKVSAVSRKS